MLRYYVDTQTAADKLYHVIRRVLTALIHNAGTAEQFSPIATVVLGEFKTAVISSTENVNRFLPVVVTMCSIRRGSRLTRMSFRGGSTYASSSTSCRQLHS